MDVAELVNSVVRKVLEQLQEKDEQGNCVLILGEQNEPGSAKAFSALGNPAQAVYFGEDTTNLAVTRYVLPVLSCCDMADLATGRASGPVMQEVLRLLLLGKPVEVLEFAYTAHSETAPNALYSLYAAHEHTLATFGLTRFRPKQPDAIRFRQDLVTAADVSRAGAEGASVLMVPLGANITPLAAELAGNLHITILKRL